MTHPVGRLVRAYYHAQPNDIRKTKHTRWVDKATVGPYVRRALADKDGRVLMVGWFKV